MLSFITMNNDTFNLRPARASEQARIRQLVRQGRINPTGLRWERFLVAVSTEGEVIGCAQIKPHADGSRELASVVVTPTWRQRGVARSLIEHLLQHNAPPIYLTCRAVLEDFYTRFGFRVIPTEALPRYFRRIARLAGILRIPLRIMRWDGDQPWAESDSWHTPPVR